MEDVLSKSLIVSVAVVLCSAVISAIAFTIVLGYSIVGALQDDVVTYYSEAGLSIMVDANNLDDLDAANVYKMLEVNRNIITDTDITLLDGSHVVDTRDLLSIPTARFKVDIYGDSSVGFEVRAVEVPHQRAPE